MVIQSIQAGCTLKEQVGVSKGFILKHRPVLL